MHFSSNRGIATPLKRTGLAMTGNLEPARQIPIYTCLYVYRLFGDDFLIDIPQGLGYTDHGTVRIAGKKGDFIMTVREIADS